jgi:hypothetical protein
MISLDCFACKSKITAPDEAAGRSGKCPKCGTIILFPSGTLNIQATPPDVPKPRTIVARPKKKTFAKKETSRLPVYLAVGTLGGVIMLALALWIGVSFYLESRSRRLVQEQELAELQRRREVQEKQNSFLTAKQELDKANLTLVQEKQKKDREAFEEFNRQNEELKRKRDQAAQEATKELQKRNDEQVKETQEKQKQEDEQKRRELERKKQLDMIEEDHKTILAYGKIHIKNNIKDMLWSPPLRAVSVNKQANPGFVEKQGLLYRLQGVVGQNRKPVSYFFLVVNREVIEYQPAKSISAVTICKIIGELETP